MQLASRFSSGQTTWKRQSNLQIKRISVCFANIHKYPIYIYMYMCHFQQEMHHESKMAAASRILAVESREWQASKI